MQYNKRKTLGEIGMKVTIYAYDIFTRRMRGKENKDVEKFENDFLEVVNGLCERELRQRNYKLEKVNQKIYLLEREYYEDLHTLFLKFGSAQYKKVRKVINTDTLESDPAKKKTPKDGDEEITCMIVKFSKDEKSKMAKCLVQMNSNGVSLSKILEYLNGEIAKYHKTIVKDSVNYRVCHNNIVSQDFLKALENTNRIKSVKLVVDMQEIDVSEFKMFSEKNDIKKEFDITLKPVKRGMSIGTDTVKDFFKEYRGAGMIRRIYVNSDSLDGNPLSFDTEKMKQKESVEVSETSTGEPDVEDIKTILLNSIKLY